ncbi:MAG: Ig-like domain-containing protein [Methanobrevibacter ruminantium]|uniref:Ig-like domain-containing protein n=1 Tax=Methanobrevibacter ruminantium TaxID=83816 RepID=UPI0026F16048|nr:Ig-like domain-containing protein [Methanobrevibacter ruminantium]MDO5842405.1 Ig-like domain-containing protein [Methanobrevibacter ruminantium]
MFFCCLGSVFAIDDFDSGYVSDEMGAGSISSYLNVDCNGNVEIDDDYVDKLYLKSDISSNNKLDKEDVLTNSSSPRRYVSDVPVVNDSSVVDGGSVSTKGTKTKTKIVASNLNMDYYDGSKLIAYIKTTSNTPIKGVKVTFKVNGKTYNRTSDSNGKVVLGITNGITLYPGSYSCLIKFAGNSAYAASNKTVNYANDLNNGITDQRLANFGLDVGLSLIPFVSLEGKVAKTVVSSDAVIGRIVLSRGVGSVSDKIVTRSSFAFEKYLIERGESELLYNGYPELVLSLAL